ncbi:hypothetical protein CYLTODRAFT_414410 [Cylindrobasidium torrendii FP15055 ss-10]|uniref:Uncharacterized protein n=1 Tax=Cylindrobasidium torrendii FP15055 ss-10 TaxID=1314674 RepID=A0A0D7B041_9AGAR|nr:hypothetical protein CYLTODRAFT_414410 [Cylindrobasidium torrendii FP15055 ss-10]
MPCFAGRSRLPAVDIIDTSTDDMYDFMRILLDLLTALSLVGLPPEATSAKAKEKKATATAVMGGRAVEKHHKGAVVEGVESSSYAPGISTPLPWPRPAEKKYLVVPPEMRPSPWKGPNNAPLDSAGDVFPEPKIRKAQESPPRTTTRGFIATSRRYPQMQRPDINAGTTVYERLEPETVPSSDACNMVDEANSGETSARATGAQDIALTRSIYSSGGKNVSRSSLSTIYLSSSEEGDN